jgi:uncharacterized protein YtpQ (UPF0354 family)
MDWRYLLMQPTLSNEQLREAFRTALASSTEFRSVVDVAGEALELDACTAGGTSIRVDLTRLYHDVLRSEYEARVRRFQDHVAATLETASVADGTTAAPSRDQLVPTIKSMAWLAGVPTPGIAAAPFVGDLVVVYAWDRDRSISYASKSQLEAAGLTMATAQPLALDNLRKRLPLQLSTRGDGKSFVFTAGGNIEASLILLPEIWASLASQLPGEIVACVVARDICIVTATAIPDGLKSLRVARDRIVGGGMAPSELISITLLVRRKSAWSVMADQN